MAKVIKVENLSKAYQLGDFGTGTITRDFERFWARFRGKEDPFLKIGEANDRTVKSNSDVVWSLKDINFDIEQGEAVGIIGRNGAGKSTLLKLLSRVTSPTTGSIKIKGRIASLLEVGTGFHPELTGKENIFLNGAILGMRKAEIKRKFDEIVDFSGVERYIDTPVKRYSSGMYVRLAFAVAAHLESEILIVDEVLAVGDAEFQKKCLGKMDEVSKGEGRTVLFVSHNMTTISSLCEKSIFLSNGELMVKGNTNAVIRQYHQSIVNSSVSHINERTDRSGSGEIRVTDIDINDNLSGCNIGNTEGLCITLTYTSLLPVYYGKIYIGIYNELGAAVMFLDSDTIPDFPSKLPGKGKVTIDIPNYQALTAGTYIINIAVFINSAISDYVQNAYTFTIVEDDFLGNGKLPAGQYMFIPKQFWQITESI
ncbi:ABC transporter ATP-binding protein [Mucilaginibacter sp. AK015]|uniref:ABC transporter ATP-binding protein n=1 Tax=Mucilaginibacter sp. AK015 TaxID=2723072 RepID=UPI001609A0A3|nr:ABC transporter ATP-binding protein [Mucilaginibacter sp. AK015]MBB5395334.1 lipopolysaccharide transport system ATP-binding protein [Mucilaginibacter sp. AK015]